MKTLNLLSILFFLITLSACGGGSDSGSSQGIEGDADGLRADVLDNRGDDRARLVDGREVRSFDGSNNNPKYPDWGASFIALQRFAPAAYSDGVSEFAGAGRPSARVVSNNIVDQAEGESIPNSFGTSDFLWQWGQFIDHDLDLTDGVDSGEGDLHAIEVPAGDFYFDPQSVGGVTISFNRARIVPGTGTSPDNPLQQENEISGWIDASHVYGSDNELSLIHI